MVEIDALMPRGITEAQRERGESRKGGRRKPSSTTALVARDWALGPWTRIPAGAYSHWYPVGATNSFPHACRKYEGYFSDVIPYSVGHSQHFRHLVLEISHLPR